MFELIINILLFIFFGYTFFTHVLEAAAKVANNPYALQPDVWPKAIIILLEICLIVNIIQIIKKNKGKPEFTLGAFVGSIPAFLKSKLFFGIVIMVVASFILDTVGFIVTSLFILFFYGLLIGEKNIVRLLIASVCIGETFAAGEVAFIISENSDQMCKMPKATQIAATITKARKESSRLS